MPDENYSGRKQMPFLGTSSDMSVEKSRIDMMAAVFHNGAKVKEIFIKSLSLVAKLLFL